MKRLTVVLLFALMTACRKDEGSTAKLPDGWPSEKVPLYPNATVTDSMSKPKEMQVTAFVPDDMDKVESFYKDKLGSLPDTKYNRGSNGGKQIVFAADGSMGVIAIEPTQPKTTLRITIAKLKAH